MKNPFARLAMAAVGLLDTLLIEEKSEDFATLLESKMKTALGRLLVFILLFIGIIVPSLFVFSYPFENPSSYSTLFYLIGTVVPFVLLPFIQKKRSDYNYLSQLLHRLVLNHYNLGRWLLQKQIGKVKKESISNQRSVIITGLARAGTTALTKTLHERGNFGTLNYSNMPFLMYPRLWKRFYNPKQKENKERAHKDGVKVGLASVEALEEYFFKVQLNDAYITQDGLKKHEIKDAVCEQYISYQASISEGKTYLAKNNNQILRLNSLTSKSKNLHVFVLFRDPLEHAHSLLHQHLSFSKEQEEDAFILEYMNWLGHHEFGLNQKPFLFGDATVKSDYQTTELGYWVERWVDYYDFALTQENLHFISYQQFLETPQLVLNNIASITGETIDSKGLTLFDKKKKDIPFDNLELKQKAEKIYKRLLVPGL